MSCQWSQFIHAGVPNLTEDENNDFENSAGCEYEEEGYDGGWEEEEIEEKVVWTPACPEYK